MSYHFWTKGVIGIRIVLCCLLLFDCSQPENFSYGHDRTTLIYHQESDDIYLYIWIHSIFLTAWWLLFAKNTMKPRVADYFPWIKYIYIYVCVCVCVYIYISKVKLATIVEGDPKAPFSIATTPRCRGGRYSIPWIAPLYPWTVPYNAEC